MTAKNAGSSYYRYDEQSRPFESITGDNGRHAIDYYPNGWLRSLTDPGNPDNWDFFYYYDVNGNIITSQAEDSWEGFAYDSRDKWHSHHPGYPLR